MCEVDYRHDNWFVPHPSPTYHWITSPNELPNPSAPLPAHTSLSSLFIEHILCLHVLTHRILLYFSLSLTSIIFCVLTVAIFKHHCRLRRRGHSLLSMLCPPSSSTFWWSSSLFSSSTSSFSTFSLSLLLCLCSFLVLILGSLRGLTLIHGESPLLLSFTFVTLFSSLFFLLAIKQYALLIIRSLPISLPSILSSPLVSRLYLSLLAFFAIVFCVTFLFIVLALMSPMQLHGVFLMIAIAMCVFSQSVTLLCLIVELHLIRRHVRSQVQLQLQSMASASTLGSPLLPSHVPLSSVTSAVSTTFSYFSSQPPSSPTSLFASLSAHSQHLRNSQMILGLHAGLYLLLAFFIVTAQPRYHQMHGVLINTLLTIVSLTFLIAFSFPIRADGADEEEEQTEEALKSMLEVGGEEEWEEDESEGKEENFEKELKVDSNALQGKL